MAIRKENRHNDGRPNTEHENLEGMFTNPETGDSQYGDDSAINMENAGFVILGAGVSSNVEQHYNEMKKLLEPMKIGVKAITQGLDFPLIVYTRVLDGVVYYYPTIVTDDNKKGASVSNFLNSLSKDSTTNIYLPDSKYSTEADDEKVRSILRSDFPSAQDFYLCGVSVMNYTPSTYAHIASYVTRLVYAGGWVSKGKDQNKNFTKQNASIPFNMIPERQIVTDTGFTIRADFKLALNIPKDTTSKSKNESNADYVNVFGYIDLAVVEEPVPPAPGYNPIAVPATVTKLSPTVIITYIQGISALPGYGMIGLITAAHMIMPEMYFGYIKDNIADYQDIISTLIGEELNFAKMTDEQKIDILSKVLTGPALAVDVPNNGYMEELSFLVPRATREQDFKMYAERFLLTKFENTMVIGDVPVPLIDVFDQGMLVDARRYDASKIAKLTKNKQLAISMSTFTNDVSNENASSSLINICDVVQEIGLDGNISATVARIFLSQQGLEELYTKSGLNAAYRPLYVASSNGVVGAIRRNNFVNQKFHAANYGVGSGYNPRVYTAY